jgi:hypothetical protein
MMLAVLCAAEFRMVKLVVLASGVTVIGTGVELLALFAASPL